MGSAFNLASSAYTTCAASVGTFRASALLIFLSSMTSLLRADTAESSSARRVSFNSVSLKSPCSTSMFWSICMESSCNAIESLRSAILPSFSVFRSFTSIWIADALVSAALARASSIYLVIRARPSSAEITASGDGIWRFRTDARA